MVIFLIMVFGSLSLFVLVLTLWSYIKWTDCKRILTKEVYDNTKKYDNLKVGSISYGKIKVMTGFKVQTTIIVSSENIIIVPSKMTFGLFQTELPVEFNKKTKLIPTTIKITALNRVLIECQKDTFSLGRVKVVYEIDTKNCKDKNEFIEKMKNWC
jgi:hypothetical protein